MLNVAGRIHVGFHVYFYLSKKEENITVIAITVTDSSQSSPISYRHITELMTVIDTDITITVNLIWVLLQMIMFTVSLRDIHQVREKELSKYQQITYFSSNAVYSLVALCLKVKSLPESSQIINNILRCALFDDKVILYQ